MKPILTKKPMGNVVVFRTDVRDIELLQVAAGSKKISRAQFLREALREKARRVLLGDDQSDEQPTPAA